MEITETVLIKKALPEVYATFENLNRWLEILPDVLDVKVLYFDGYNQEFTMMVERPAGPETVRGIRYCRLNSELELFQPVPPPGLAMMCGRWQFEETPAGTQVVARRSFKLLPAEGEDEGAREAAFGQKLRGFLATNLRLFKEALELDGSAAN